MKRDNGKRIYKTAMYGLLTALAMILSYVETLLPVSVGIPGVKLGLANLVVLIALYALGWKDALMISMVRVLLVSATFGSMASLQFALAGALVSFLVMTLCRHWKIFGKTGVSIAGGIGHNTGQLVVAAVVLENTAVFTYFPVLLLSGTVTGALIGLLGGQILRRLPQTKTL